ncbi:MAG: class I SAM-dependent methyltransferase [Thermomicrobiales bacterium]|nr:class I SAM-dependent methyltransferase [Thermomicrobiales bacterium]
MSGAPSMPRLESEQTDFDLVADAYDESLPAHVVEHYLAKRVAYIRRHTLPGTALDLGCGTGVLAERVRAAGYDVVAMDPFRGMLSQLRHRQPDFPVVQGNGTALPFPDATFDLVYCVAVMHHIADPLAVRRTLVEMARVTRPGGHVLIWDHNPRNPYWPLLMHRVPQDTGAERLIPQSEITAGLRAGGAQLVRADLLGLVPDFAPPPLLAPAARLERIVERAPGLRWFCAHNVVLAVKT